MKRQQLECRPQHQSQGEPNILDAAAEDQSSGQAWAVGQFSAVSGALQTLTEFNP
jgi:hypothetical protein